MRDHPRLARAGARQNEDRAVGREHSFALLRIQAIKNVHAQKISCGSGPGGNCILAERKARGKPRFATGFP